MQEDNDENARSMPQAGMAEKAVLSMILKAPAVWLPRAKGDGLTEDHFWIQRPLWVAMCQRFEAGLSFELVSFVQDLHLAEELAELGGAAMISEVYNFATEGMSHAWGDWLRALREALARRLALRKAGELGEAQSGEEAARVATEAMDMIASAIVGPKRAVTGKELAKDWLRWFEETRNAGDLPGLPTGLGELDNITGGMIGGDLWVVCGKPSRGKSVLKMQISANVMHAGGTVAVFSLEMTRNQVLARMVSYRGPLEYTKLTQPRECKTKSDFIILQRALREISEESLYLDDKLFKVDEIAGEAQRIKDSNGRLDLVVVDYLQLAKATRHKGDSREQEVAQVSATLKRLAKTLGCPVLTGSQLNDDGKTRESRAIEQDADVMLWIVEDGVKVGKNRNGRRGDNMALILDGQYQRFRVGRPDQ